MNIFMVLSECCAYVRYILAISTLWLCAYY